MYIRFIKNDIHENHSSYIRVSPRRRTGMISGVVAIGIADAPKILYMAKCLLRTFKMNLRPEQFLLVLRPFFTFHLRNALPSSRILFLDSQKYVQEKTEGAKHGELNMTFIRAILLMSPVDGKKPFTPSVKSQTSGQHSYRLFLFGNFRA